MDKSILLFLFLFLALPTFSQHKSSIGVHLGFNMVKPSNSRLNVIFESAGGEIRKERKFHISFGGNYSYRIFTNTMVTSGLIYNAYGHNINYYGIPGFENRDVFITNRYLTIPLLLRHEVSINNLSFFLETGLLTNIYLNTRWIDTHFETDRTKRLDYVNSGDINFSAYVGIGIQFDLSQYNQMFITPNFKYLPDGDFFHSVEGYTSFGVDFGFRRALSLDK